MRPILPLSTQPATRSNAKIVWTAAALLGLLAALALWLVWSPPLRAYSPARPVNAQSLPQELVPLDGIVQVTAGGAHTCALTNAGGVKCWGANYTGQLGDGTLADKNTPVDVMGLGSSVAAIAAGSYHTCALTTAGGVKCWGDNSYGQLGDGTAWRATLVDVVVEVALGNQIFLPLIRGRSSGATTSSATLAQPPARGELGLLGGLLAAGFAIGMALVFWGEPETMEPVQIADEQQTDDITQV